MEKKIDVGEILEEYATPDMSLAVHLILVGCKMLTIRKVDERKGEFVFRDVSEKNINDFYNETKKFSVLEVMKETRSLKNRMWNSPL